MSYQVLVVDDDIAICEALERNLRLKGFAVQIANDGEEAISAVETTPPDLIVLDIGMPKIDGIQVTEYLRNRNHMMPICILSAQDEVADRVRGLEAGADDYLVKPFAFAELLARIKALLRRSQEGIIDTVEVGDFQLNQLGRVAEYAGVNLELTKIEFDLLAVLITHMGQVLSRYQLLELVWGYDFEVDSNVVDVFIGYLRRKMRNAGSNRVIHTVRGVGFVFRV